LQKEIDLLGRTLLDVKKQIKYLQAVEKELKDKIEPYLIGTSGINLKNGRIYLSESEGLKSFPRKSVIPFLRSNYGDLIANHVDRECTKHGPPRKIVYVHAYNQRRPDKYYPDVNNLHYETLQEESALFWQEYCELTYNENPYEFLKLISSNGLKVRHIEEQEDQLDEEENITDAEIECIGCGEVILEENLCMTIMAMDIETSYHLSIPYLRQNCSVISHRSSVRHSFTFFKICVETGP